MFPTEAVVEAEQPGEIIDWLILYVPRSPFSLYSSLLHFTLGPEEIHPVCAVSVGLGVPLDAATLYTSTMTLSLQPKKGMPFSSSYYYHY